MRKQVQDARPVIGSVENFKRRRALPNAGNDMQFFDRALAMKKLQEFIFIPKNVAKDR